MHEISINDGTPFDHQETLAALERRVVRAHSRAPLSIEARAYFDVAPRELWPHVTDPKLIAAWFSAIRDGSADHAASCAPGEWGTGSKRYCDAGMMGTLDETILCWEPPEVCAYNVRNPMMPIDQHVALMLVVDRGRGCDLVWRQYFDLTGVMMRLFFPAMMRRMMREGLGALATRLGGHEVSVRSTSSAATMAG